MAQQLGDVIADQIRRYRKQRDLSIRELSEECIRIAPGSTLTPASLTNIERGQESGAKRGGRAVTIEELLTLAAALRMPPLLLICPFDKFEAVEIFPGMLAFGMETAEWINGGDLPMNLPPDASDEEQQAYEVEYRHNTLPLRLLAEYVAACDRVRQLFQRYRAAGEALLQPIDSALSAAAAVRSVHYGVSAVIGSDMPEREVRAVISDAAIFTTSARRSQSQLTAAMEEARVTYALLEAAVAGMMRISITKDMTPMKIPRDLHEAMDLFYARGSEPTRPPDPTRARMSEATDVAARLQQVQDDIDKIIHEALGQLKRDEGSADGR